MADEVTVEQRLADLDAQVKRLTAERDALSGQGTSKTHRIRELGVENTRLRAALRRLGNWETFTVPVDLSRSPAGVIAAELSARMRFARETINGAERAGERDESEIERCAHQRTPGCVNTRPHAGSECRGPREPRPLADHDGTPPPAKVCERFSARRDGTCRQALLCPEHDRKPGEVCALCQPVLLSAINAAVEQAKREEREASERTIRALGVDPDNDVREYSNATLARALAAIRARVSSTEAEGTQGKDSTP